MASSAPLDLQLLLGSGRCSKLSGRATSMQTPGGACRLGDIQFIDDDLVAYSCGDLVIVMNSTTGKQFPYTGHTNMVSCMAYGPAVRLIASGQYRMGHTKMSEVHIWDPYRLCSEGSMRLPTLRLAFHDSPYISSLCWLPGSAGYLCSVGGGMQKQIMAIWKVGPQPPTKRMSISGAARQGIKKPICTTTCASAEVVGSSPLFEHEDAYQWAVFGHGRMVKIWTLSRYQPSVRWIRVSFPGSTTSANTSFTPRSTTGTKSSAFARAASAMSNIITSLACVERAPYNHEKLVVGSGDGVVYFTEGHICLRSTRLEAAGDPARSAVVYLKVLRKRVVALQENGWCTILGDQHQSKSHRVAPVGERLIGACFQRHFIALQTAENPLAGVLDTHCDLLKQDASSLKRLTASAPTAPCTCVAASANYIIVGCSDGGKLYIYRKQHGPVRATVSLAIRISPEDLLRGANGVNATLSATCVDVINTEAGSNDKGLRVAVGYSNGFLVIFDISAEATLMTLKDITIQYSRGISRASPITACHLSSLGSHCAAGCHDGLAYLLTFKNALLPNEEANETDSLVARKDVFHGHMSPIDTVMFVETGIRCSTEGDSSSGNIPDVHKMVHGTVAAANGSGRRLLNPRDLAQQAENARAEIPSLCLLTCSSRDNQVLCFDARTRSRIPQTLKVLEIARSMCYPHNRWRLPSKAAQVCMDLNILAGPKGSRPYTATSTISTSGAGGLGDKQVRASPGGRFLCYSDRTTGVLEVVDATNVERIASRKSYGSAVPIGVSWVDNCTIVAVALDGTVSIWSIPGLTPSEQKKKPEITEAELRAMLDQRDDYVEAESDSVCGSGDKENHEPTHEMMPIRYDASDEAESFPIGSGEATPGGLDKGTASSADDYGVLTWESPQRSMQRKSVLEAERTRQVTIAGKIGENQPGPTTFPWKEEGFVAGTPSYKFNPSGTSTDATSSDVSKLIGDSKLSDPFKRNATASSIPVKPSRGSFIKIETSLQGDAYVIDVRGPKAADQHISKVTADLGAQILHIESPIDSNSVRVPIGFDLSTRLKIDMRRFERFGSIRIMVPRRRAGTVCGYGEKLLLDTTKVAA